MFARPALAGARPLLPTLPPRHAHSHAAATRKQRTLALDRGSVDSRTARFNETGMRQLWAYSPMPRIAMPRFMFVTSGRGSC